MEKRCLKIYPERRNSDAALFCARFIGKSSSPRYVMGRNEYAVSIATSVEVDGFIDEFTDEPTFLGKPIFKIVDLPKESLVVSAVVLGRPIIALSKLKRCGLICLDYFSFLKYSGLPLKEIDALNKGKLDIETNMEKYEWIYGRLEDAISQDVLGQLLNFRFSSDLDYMRGFEYAEDRQYFEDFLELKPGEVFVDAGGFDGKTTLEFIKRCPDYKSVHFFEPDPKNIELAHGNLSKHRDIQYYTLGLAESRRTLRFCSGGGAASKVSEAGEVEIHVDAIDNLIEEPITLIKMDIEGAEGIALTGARSRIFQDRPKLAVCCYHKFDDIWKIPKQILAMRTDYSVYLRHYNEGVTETVMYFIPRE